MHHDLEMLKAYIFMMEKYLGERERERDYERAYLAAGVARQLLNNIIEELEAKAAIAAGE